MNLILSNVKSIKKIVNILVDDIKDNDYEYDEEKPRKYSEDEQMKYLVKTLNSMNDFLMLLVMSYVGKQLKILRMYWYSSMKPFQTNLYLVMNKFLCSWNVSLPEVYYYYNDMMLSVTGRYIYC